MKLRLIESHGTIIETSKLRIHSNCMCLMEHCTCVNFALFLLIISMQCGNTNDTKIVAAATLQAAVKNWFASVWPFNVTQINLITNAELIACDQLTLKLESYHFRTETRKIKSFLRVNFSSNLTCLSRRLHDVWILKMLRCTCNFTELIEFLQHVITCDS